ncbi:hypothetical protein [Paenarthrobacter ureafaciens]|uniref:hypothetical protein n=1 Tax=Paenarthrobacter ureafaciens TaxID=37931 RepID=UPI0019175146|nr:hypothetical protein [Paenarthrobacter ureafaciens]QQQ64341.1 hypothetical protein JHQ56_19910 [Paenarthrobacter ureafaciens]
MSVAQALHALPPTASERAYREAVDAFAGLELPPRLNLELIVRVVEAIRGRRIRIRTTDKLAGTSICGLWLPGKRHEWVFHPPTPWELQRQQFVLHELSHMILGHDAHPGAGSLLHEGLQHLSPEVIRRALMRTEFRTVEEATAEYLADLLAEALREGPGEPGAFEEVFG